MDRNPLNVISNDQNEDSKPQKSNRRIETQAKYDRIWLKNPEKFITKNAVENKISRKRLISLIQKHCDINKKKVVDLGCGYGFLSRELRDLGCFVDAVDISQNALKEFEKSNLTNIKLIHDFLPKSFLSDDQYDLVIASDLIGSLKEEEFRLFFSELARIVKSDGYIIVSTPIDLASEDALQRFASLASTELEFIEWSFSYNLLYITLLDYLLFPQRVIRGSKDNVYRKVSLEKRYSLNKLWFKWNSTRFMSYFWRGINVLFNPLASKLQNNEKIILFLEKISKLFWKERAISHAILLGKRKRLIVTPLTETPSEMKHKKQVWE